MPWYFNRLYFEVLPRTSILQSSLCLRLLQPSILSSQQNVFNSPLSVCISHENVSTISQFALPKAWFQRRSAQTSPLKKIKPYFCHSLNNLMNQHHTPALARLDSWHTTYIDSVSPTSHQLIICWHFPSLIKGVDSFLKLPAFWRATEVISPSLRGRDLPHPPIPPLPTTTPPRLMFPAIFCLTKKPI